MRASPSVRNRPVTVMAQYPETGRIPGSTEPSIHFGSAPSKRVRVLLSTSIDMVNSQEDEVCDSATGARTAVSFHHLRLESLCGATGCVRYLWTICRGPPLGVCLDLGWMSAAITLLSLVLKRAICIGHPVSSPLVYHTRRREPDSSLVYHVGSRLFQESRRLW